MKDEGDVIDMIGKKLYVVLGIRNFQAPRDGNVYIDVNQFRTLDSLKDAILQGEKASDQTIFLISDERYLENAKQIMLNIGVVNGKIQVFTNPIPKREMSTLSVSQSIGSESGQVTAVDSLPSEKVDHSSGAISSESIDAQPIVMDRSAQTLKRTDATNHSAVVSNVIPSASTAIKPESVTIQNEIKKDDEVGVPVEAVSKEEKKERASYSYQPENNIYRREFEPSSSNGGTARDSVGYMGYNPTLVNQNVKSLVKVKKSPKSAAFVQLPVIIFILSAILLIISGVLLFVLD